MEHQEPLDQRVMLDSRVILVHQVKTVILVVLDRREMLVHLDIPGHLEKTEHQVLLATYLVQLDQPDLQA